MKTKDLTLAGNPVLVLNPTPKPQRLPVSVARAHTHNTESLSLSLSLSLSVCVCVCVCVLLQLVHPLLLPPSSCARAATTAQSSRLHTRHQDPAQRGIRTSGSEARSSQRAAEEGEGAGRAGGDEDRGEVLREPPRAWVRQLMMQVDMLENVPECSQSQSSCIFTIERQCMWCGSR